MDSEEIGFGRIYDDPAFLMSFISPPGEYAEEASHWRALLREKLGAGETILETIIVFLIESLGKLRIEHDRHPTGIFPRATWLRLMRETGFSVEARSFRLEAQRQPYELQVGTRS